MKYLTTEEINTYKVEYNHPKDLIIEKGLSYPTIVYQKDTSLAWEEFDKCFNELHKKYWSEKLRMKVAEGKSFYSAFGR